MSAGRGPFTAARALAVLLALAVLASSSSVVCVVDAFYFPGASPTYYGKSEPVEFWVNSIRSTSQLFPKSYYFLPFCKPAEVKSKKDSVGELIWGDRQQSSLYAVKMLENSSCAMLAGCDVEANNKAIKSNANALRTAIEKDYRGFMNIDNLPVFDDGATLPYGQCSKRKDSQAYAQRGYALGTKSACVEKGPLLHNHLDFTVFYNEQPEALRDSPEPENAKYMVVGLKVVPYSVKHVTDASCSTVKSVSELISTHDTLSMDEVEKGAPVYWSHSVTWIHSDVKWATRWDAYFHSSVAGSNTTIHLMYMGLSLIVMLIVSGAVGSVLARALRRDVVRYNSLAPEELQEETGWKLVHADVFRPPDRPELLSIVFGNGCQLLLIVGLLLVGSALGILSPSRRGSLMIALVMTSAFMSIGGGAACGFLQQYLNCKSWRGVVLCGTAMQGALCSVYLLTVIIGKANHSTTAVPFGVIFTLFALWVTVSLPLTILGASFAFHQEPLKNPVRVGRLAREIPVQPLMNQPFFLYLMPPLFPLVTIIMELHFLMQALWAGQVYYVFGFMLFAGVVWVVVAALTTVSQLYYVLCYENHRWWWPAFMCAGGMGLHVFLYAIYFFFTQLTISGFASSLLYFLYMGLLSASYGLVAGAVGLCAGIVFVRTIYGSIKVD